MLLVSCLYQPPDLGHLVFVNPGFVEVLRLLLHAVWGGRIPEDVWTGDHCGILICSWVSHGMDYVSGLSGVVTLSPVLIYFLSFLKPAGFRFCRFVTVYFLFKMLVFLSQEGY